LQEKENYRRAITAWVIVLVILVIIFAVMGYLLYNGRESLKAQNQQLSVMDKKISKKREEVAVLTKLIDGPTPLPNRDSEKVTKNAQ